MEEYNRLLYVALTRAEDRLIVCGFSPKSVPDACWYRLVEGGLAKLPAETGAFDAWDGVVRRYGCPQAAPPDRADAPRAQAEPVLLPGWLGAAPHWMPAKLPPEPTRPERLAPSRPENATLGPVPASPSPLDRIGGAEARFRRGRLLHLLLQHLPELPPHRRAAAAQKFLSRPGAGLTPGEVDAAVGEVLAVMAEPALADLFGPGSRAEVPLTGVVQGQVVGGLVDRLAVLPDRVLLADYKTGRLPPAGAQDVPVLYLRQMAAYRAVLQEAFPDRAVNCVLIWTLGPCVVPLPDALLQKHRPVDPRAAESHLLA